MTRVRFAFCAVVASASLAACMPSLTPEQVEAELKEATVAAVCSVKADTVVVSRQMATATRWLWDAEAGGKAYICDADVSFALPVCQVAPSTSME